MPSWPSCWQVVLIFGGTVGNHQRIFEEITLVHVHATITHLHGWVFEGGNEFGAKVFPLHLFKLRLEARVWEHVHLHFSD